MKIEMFDYQKKAHAKIWKAFVRKKRVLAVMATGLGKTILAAFCVLTLFKKKVKNGQRRRILFLCHDNGILEQAVTEFRKVLGEKYSLGIFHGQEKVYDEVDILFASFQTLGGNKNRDGWKEAFLEDEFDFIIVDESHHSHAGTYKPVIYYFKPRYLLGITATPDRMDKKNIREIFGKEIVNYPLEKAIARGWLTPIEYRIITDNLNTPALQKLARQVLSGDKRVSIKQLNETIFVKVRDEEIAKRIMEHGKKTLIFCESILHTENFQPFIPGSEICHSKRSYRENQEVLQKLRDGEIQCVLSVNKFNEGIDIPDVELVVFLRCTDSETVFWQQLGRGLRKIPGKEKVTILDFVANCDRVAMIKDLTKGVEDGSEEDFEKDPLHLSGKTFKFVFSEEFREIADIINKIKMKRRISDIPELAAEYMAPPKNELPAEEVTVGIAKKLWWKCSKCEHEWEATGTNRVRQGSGCPACSGRVATKNNNLAITHPDLAEEYMAPPKNLLPVNKILPYTNKKLWWKCSECQHKWETKGKERVQGTGCPACANRVVTKNNNLAITHPELAEEYMAPPKNELPADKVVAGTNKKLWWKCSKEECGHEWEAMGISRFRGSGCPACANKVVTENNNLAVARPELAEEYMAPPKNELPADKVVPGTNKKLWWKCSKCGHEWKTMGNDRVQGKGCPACSGLVATDKKNLAVVYPELAKEYMAPPKNLLPADKVVVGTQKKLWWKCSECGHEWEASGSHRTRGRGCPACANRVVTENNNLAVARPELAEEYMAPPKNELSADKVVAGTNKKLWWKCSKCEHEWEATGSNRFHQGSGCPACANRVVTKNNNLAITHPELAEEYMAPPKNLLPADKVVAGANKKFWWKCSKCEHEWEAVGNSRFRGVGCPKWRNHKK